MKQVANSVRIVVVAGMLSVLPAGATTLVVNSGRFASAEIAGTSEEQVNWRDADSADDTACTESFAALELQSYLRRLTGAAGDFAIVDDGATPDGDLIVVGGPASNAGAARLAADLGIAATDVAGLGPNGYRIVSRQAGGRRVTLLAGGSRIGTLYAAYDLLHHLGVRWHAPGALHEEVPAGSLREIPDLDLRETPAFLTRGFHAWEDRGNVDFVLWMARNRLNMWCVEQSQKALMHKLGIMLLGGGHSLTEDYLGPRQVYPYDHPRFTGDEGKPADPYAVSPEYQGDANGDGKLSRFEAHPEWYALRNGHRSDAIHGDGGDNFCTANADAMTEWTRNAVTDLAEGQYRDADLINAWMLDGGKWCECDACKAQGTPTDRNLLVIYSYDQAIKKAQAEGRINRPVRLLFLAYADVLQPPSHPLPAGFDTDTCIATYFPIVRCYVHRFDDPNCSVNSRYRAHLVGWAEKPERYYQGQLCIGEYYNVSGYKCLPVCYMHTMATDIPYYYNMGARHFHYMHVTTRDWGNKALTNWQMARQLWDPKTDVEALWQDYFATRYGPAAAEMRRFYESLERMLCNVSELKYGLARRLASGAAELFPGNHLKYAATVFPKDDGVDLEEMLASAVVCRQILTAASQAGLPERIAGRIAEDDRLFTYGERTLHFYDALCRAYALVRSDHAEEARAALGEARALAAQLEADTVSASTSSSHANARNALDASFAAGALSVLNRRVGPVSLGERKPLGPANPELVLTGRDFEGGGAPRFGYDLCAFPGRVKLSDHGNYVYAKGSGAEGMTAWFQLDALPETDLTLSLSGITCPEPIGGTVNGEIRLNDKILFSGRMPLAERELTVFEAVVPRAALKQGMNVLDILNTETQGGVGSRPWFGIDRLTLTWRTP
jgi:hypothetical protein